MQVSICILTRNRHQSLMRTLRSIMLSDHDSYEILVIDNSDEDVFLKNSEICTRNSRIRHIRANHKAGIAALRQIGIDEGVGETIAFVDDDIEVPREWLATVAHAFESDELLCIYGCQRQDPDADPKAQAADWGNSCRALGTNGALRIAESGELVVTFSESVLALRRKCAANSGGFDRRFKWGYEGADLTHRMLESGCKIRFDPRVTVQHHYREYRSRPKWDGAEYYRLLFFFKYYDLKQFSLIYELRRVYYFLIRRDYLKALFNSFNLLVAPLTILAAKRKPR